MRVTKCWDPAAGQLWPPLLPLLKSVGIDVVHTHDVISSYYRFKVKREIEGEVESLGKQEAILGTGQRLGLRRDSPAHRPTAKHL